MEESGLDRLIQQWKQ